MAKQIAHAIIIRDEKFLAVRELGKPYWKLPGGEIEQGETPETALERELHEEIAITVYSAEKIHQFNNLFKGREMEFHTYLVNTSQEPQAVDREEPSEIEWQPFSRMLNITDQVPSQQRLYHHLNKLGIIKQ